ncbi:phosphatidylinositol-specific phospholipase C1-like protein [Acetobacter sp. TBRC 12305]|uniref:Phosphatidylinositol-specific phospholipase C1-like protein n=1 Tax=Acetobacter garciniae TaxID=2817435 RepID=A0A939HLJ1_9PROT|nr:phosphatidylinositol-specific phospholipase C1-like protein [Acetobacter garciniae]MBO1326668.1 phosphatidylinositol-specific phospholipase C1-like protein [Acetobacter garciniae]MBX0345037.1 phosphatidylinositol-specific phospholipase C1-like protein [Acetobacter garciniae]
MKTVFCALPALGMVLALCAPHTGFAADEPVKMNQIQVIGTHNSYRRSIAPSTLAWLESQSPQMAQALDYRHGPLPAQLDGGMRQLEIDIYADSTGRHYANPRGAEWQKKAGLTPDKDQSDVTDTQGTDFKVMHIVDIDQRSSCEPLRNCLAIIKTWSDAHPNHLPLYIDIETKQDVPLKNGAFTKPEQFTPATYDRLDAELLSVFGRERILTPDDVRGPYKTLNEAIRTRGWPTLAYGRGKVVFTFDRPHDTARYLVGHPALRGRVVFTNGRPGDPDAAYTEANEGFVGQAGNGSAEVDNATALQQIQDLVEKGYLVRTRSDANTVEARQNDTTRRDVAFQSGAQIISTDYPSFEPAPWHNFTVSFPGGAIARCNPVNAPASCSTADISE